MDKSEVLKDLPQKTEQVIDIELTDEELAFYENLRENALNEITKVTSNTDTQHAGQRRMHILSEITKLRQACCHPAIIEPQIQMSSSKLEKLEQMLEELLENNHKVLIFSQFVSYLQHVQTSLEKNNIDYHYLDGSTPQSQRKESVEAFQNGEKSVFLLSLKAGGVGLNLTQADYVIILDPWWNPAIENQAADRAHRIGQTRPVTPYRFICKNDTFLSNNLLLLGMRPMTNIIYFLVTNPPFFSPTLTIFLVYLLANPVCGNGIRETGEQCDDGNLVDLDGCSPLCTLEAGYKCELDPVKGYDLCMRTDLL